VARYASQSKNAFATVKLVSLYHGGQFIGGRNRSTHIIPRTCHKSITNSIKTGFIKYISLLWARN